MASQGFFTESSGFYLSTANLIGILCFPSDVFKPVTVTPVDDFKMEKKLTPDS